MAVKDNKAMKHQSLGYKSQSKFQFKNNINSKINYQASETDFYDLSNYTTHPLLLINNLSSLEYSSIFVQSFHFSWN